jgi:hypothetical protein
VSEGKKSSIAGKNTCHLLNVKQPSVVTKRLKLSFQRTRASINVLKSDRTVGASLGLIDLSELGVGVFTETLLLKGSMVELCITEPWILKVKGIVAWSVPVKSGIQNARFACRTGLQFVFENETQKAAVLEFIQKVNMDPLEFTKPAPAQPAVGSEAPSSEAPPPEAGAPEPSAAEASAPAATEQPSEQPLETPSEQAPAAESQQESAPPAEGAAAAAPEAPATPPEEGGKGGSQAA